MIIFGLRGRQVTIAMLSLACRNGHVAAHRLVKLTRWFTLFFIPLIPVSQKHYTVCAQCGTQVKWSKADADAAVARAVSSTGASSTGAPVIADPFAPPLPSGPAPGWYADPNGSGGQRYWDGTNWTDATAPA